MEWQKFPMYFLWSLIQIISSCYCTFPMTKTCTICTFCHFKVFSCTNYNDILKANVLQLASYTYIALWHSQLIQLATYIAGLAKPIKANSYLSLARHSKLNFFSYDKTTKILFLIEMVGFNFHYVQQSDDTYSSKIRFMICCLSPHRIRNYLAS